MQELQLYIESERLDLFKDESITLTQTIQNIKDVAKVFTSFTQTFNVPASKTNNRIFKHYYNFHIVNNDDNSISGFDARLKKSGKIELNTIPFKTGRIKLEGVGLKNNLAHTYKITFFGNTVELPDILGDDKLDSLLFGSSDYDLEYKASTIRAYLMTSQGNGKLIVPLITHTQRLYYSGTISSNTDNLFFQGGTIQGVPFSELKFAIRLYELILEIEDKYTVANGYANNLIFSRDFFNTANPAFYNLYMWLHRKSGNVNPPQQVISFTSPTPSWTGTQTQILRNGNTIFIPSTFFLDSNGRILDNEIKVTPATQSQSVDYQIVVFLNGAQVAISSSGTGQRTLTLASQFLIPNGVLTVSLLHSSVMVIQAMEWEFEGDFTVSGQPGRTSFTDTFNTPANWTAAAVFSFDVRQQIPDMTIISFLTSMFKMFNLVAYLNDSNVIVVRPLEATSVSSFVSGKNFSYLTDDDISNENAPVNYNISEFVDTKTSEVNIALPYKEIVYEYEGLGTFLAKQHNQLFGSDWGTLGYIGGTDPEGTGGINFNASTETYKVTVPLEHMKFERLVNAANGANTDIQWGYSVNENQQPFIGKPLIFYAILQTSATPISFINTPTSTQSTNAYWTPSNSLVLGNAGTKQNINFNNELNEFTGTNTFIDTLFNVYHSNYIIDVFNTSRRLTKITSYLPLNILFNFELNDTFTIGLNTYIINSITTNLQNGKSSMELLNKV